MRIKQILTTIFTVLLSVPLLLNQAVAGNRAGAVTGQFLKLPINARVAAMGNAQVALAEGAGSIGYNPAGILSIEGAAFGSTYNQWWADITHAFFGGAVRVEGIGTIGVGVTLLTTNDIAVTTPAFPEGNGELFKATDFAFTVAYSRQISELFGLGLSVKYIRSNLYNQDLPANSIAFDIGTLYDIPTLNTRLGISVNNLGRDLKYINEQYSLPTSLRFGARTTIFEDDAHKMYAAFQIGRPNDADEQYNFGVEYVFHELLALRSGYKFNYDTENWCGGLGVNLENLGIQGHVDYSFTNYKYLPGTHMFSLEIGF